MAGSVVVGRPRWSIAPYFIVDDVVATANYYRDKLGFGYERFWGEPPCFCMVRRNGVIIMLGQLEKCGVMRPNRVVDPEGGAWDTFGSTTPTPSMPSSSRRAWRLRATFATSPTVAAISTSRTATDTAYVLGRT